uniref:DegT/DnrJ/EryC1/StrS family aminotransferase n=1 Tax=Salmonella enterica TaxID=28901 RepID=UPI0020C2B981
ISNRRHNQRFVNIHRIRKNIDETLIEAAINDKTRAIVPVNYAGVACEMDVIMAMADKYNLFVVEDAAHGVMSTYKGRALG